MPGTSLQDKSQLIPLYLGVTGHRNIRDADRADLKQLIKEYIEKKQKQCPHTPIVFLTPLSDGADRIGAQAAVESKIDFIAVLPMPADEYKQDFTLPGSVGEFENLLGKASGTIELPLQDGTTIEEIHNNREKRNEQYHQNGLFIARHCHTLVALWDGTDNKKTGGTADVVKVKRSGIPGKFEDTSKKLHHLQTGPIYHIITPRKNGLVPEGALTVREYYPDHHGSDLDQAKKNDELILSHIDSFNKDVIIHGPALKEKIAESSNSLIRNYPDLNHSEILQNIAEKHGVAEELAAFFQKRRFFSLQVLLSLVVLAFLFLQIYGEFYHKPFMLLLYPITLGIGAVWFLRAKRKRYEHKHEDYRALSEAYRIQFYLKACGKQDNVSNYYLKRHRGELEWVLYALRTSQVTNFVSDDKYYISGFNTRMEAFAFIKKNWVDDQMDWFRNKAGRHNHSSEKWEFRANLSLIIAIISALLLFLVSIFAEKFPENIKPVEEFLHSVFICTTHVFLVLAGALHGYREKMAFSEMAKNYQQMAQLFQLASQKLKHAIETNDEGEANDVIWELAQEALLENGDWLLLHRSRPLEIPKG